MDGTMFLKWLRNRLIPTFKALHGRKKLILVLDNAPYHHVHPEDSFFASQHSKEDIQTFLVRVQKTTIKVRPYVGEEQQIEPPANLSGTPWADYEQWVMVESTTGLAYYIDGMSDQGYGNAIVYHLFTKLVTVRVILSTVWTILDVFIRLIFCRFHTYDPIRLPAYG